MQVTVVGFWGGFPGANEASSGYLIEHEGFHLLLDCGSGVLSQLQNYIKIEELNAVILSHYHHDHIADVGPIQYAWLINKYLGKCNDVLPIYGHRFDNENFSKLSKDGVTKGLAYDPNEQLQIGPFSISFMKTKHPVACYAMRIKAGHQTIVYTADSSYLEEFHYFCRKADLLICECNLYGEQDGQNAGHMTSIEAGRIANNANVKKMLLTHLPHFGDHRNLVEQAKTQFNGEIILAKSGYNWK